MRLLGSGNSKKVLNGTEYVVKEVGENRVELEGCNNIVLNFDEASRFLRLRYAVCYFTIQGRTLRGQHILLFDKGSPHFSVRHLIVGLSRVIAGHFAHIPTRKQEADFLKHLC